MAGDTATEAASALFGFGKAALHIERTANRIKDSVKLITHANRCKFRCF